MGLFLITSERWLTLRNLSNLCKLSAARRPPPPLLIANAERESFVSMADHWNKSNLNLFNSNFKNPSCFWAKIASPKLISGSVKGGGRISQIYAIRQALSKALVAYYQKYVDEQSKKAIKDILVQFDRTLL